MKPYKPLTPTRGQWIIAGATAVLGGLGAAVAAYFLIMTVAILLGY